MPEKLSGGFRAFFVLNMFAVGGVVVGSTVGTAFFLETYGARFLPHVFVLTAVAAIATERLLRALGDRIAPFALFRWTLVVFGLAVAAAWAGLANGIRALTIVLYVLPELAAFAVLTQLWNIAARGFDFAESKRTFPIIAAGGSLGGALAGAGVSLASTLGSPLHTLALWLAALVFMAPVIRMIERSGASESGPQGHRGRHEEKDRARFLRRLQLRVRSFFSRTFVVVLALYAALGAALTQLLDFQSQVIFARTFESPAELARFLGIFSSVSFVIGLFIQTAVLSPIVRRIGVGNASLLFPAFTLIAGSSLAVFPVLFSAVAGAFTRRYLKGSFFTLLIDLLLNAMHSRDQGGTRAFLKGSIASVTTVVVSLLILAMADKRSVAEIAALTVFLGVAFVGSAVFLRRRYINELIEQISRGRAGFAENISLASGIVSAEIRPEYYIAALERADDAVAALLLDEHRADFPDAVIERLPEFHRRSPSGAVRAAIVRTVRSRMREKDRVWLTQILQSGDEHSMAAIFMDHFDFMEPLIMERAIEIAGDRARPARIRQAALYHACLASRQYFAYQGHLLLKASITTGNLEELLLALRVVESLKDQDLLLEFESHVGDGLVAREWLNVLERLEVSDGARLAPVLLRIYRSGDPSLRRGALRLFERTPSRGLYDELWKSFADLNPEDRAVLLRIGARWNCLGVERLARLLGDPSLSVDLFRLCARAWRGLGEAEARTVHEKRIGEKLREALYQARRDREVVENILAREGLLLAAVLDEILRRNSAKLLYWITILAIPLDACDSVYEGLISEEKNMADRAAEAIESASGVETADQARLVRALYLSPGEVPPVSPGKVAETLLRLVSDADSWTVAVAVAALARTEPETKRFDVERRLALTVRSDRYVVEALGLMAA